MKFSKYIIALLIIAMVASVGAVSAAEDTISTDDAGDSVLSADDSGVVKYYVDSNVAETGNGSESSPFKTIKEAITVTNEANVTEIYLAGGVYNSTSDRSLYVNLNHAGYGGNLSIIGSGESTIIDLLGSGYFMDNRNSNSMILLKDLTICNGKYNNYAAIRNSGTLTIDNINVYNCIETRNNYNGYVIGGGGIINVLNSRFIENRAGGGILYYVSYVFNSTFINNSALSTSGGGGAIYASFDLQVIKSTFINNTAKLNGGAISANVLDIYNSTFINNKADNFGGAIIVSGGVMQNNVFINNSAKVAGAAIYCTGGLTTSNTTVENCVSPKDDYIYFSNLDSTSSKLNYVVMDNSSMTINSVNIKVYASVFDEEGRPVSGSDVKFLLDGNSVGSAEVINGTARSSFKRYLNGTHKISVSLPNQNCDVKTASITVIPLENIDVYISPDGDDENGDGSRENPYKTFDKGFDEANGAVNANLYIKNGVYEITKSYDMNSLGNLSIIAYEGDATLDLGNVTYFAPSNSGHYFATVTGNVSFYNIAFINAYSTSSLTFGGLFKGKELKLVGCSFINNTFNLNVLDIDYVDMDSCRFINTVGNRIINGHGGKITNSYIADKSENSGYSILVAGPEEFIIDNCEFESIRIHAYANLESYKITNSIFYNGKSSSEVVRTASDIVVDNCTFVGHFRNSLYINDAMASVTNCRFINNTGTQTNVAIYNYVNRKENSLYLSNNTVINSTSDYYVYSMGYISSPYTYVVLGNESIDVESLGYKFTAIGYDDASNKINFADVDFYLNDTRLGSASYDDECAYYEYEKILDGTYIVSVKSNYIDDASIKTATLKIAPLVVEVWVSNDGDDENDGSQAHPLKTIEKATSYPAYITTVHICPGTYGIEDSLLFETRDVFYSFIGAGTDETIIDLNHEHRFITNLYSTVDISNMTILNAYQFDEDWYMSIGGAIYNDYSGTINIDSVNFINSTSDDYCYGGAIYNSGKMSISDSTFINSSAADGPGGAIYNEGSVSVVDCNFVNSYAEEGGAAIYNSNYLYIKGNTFSGENQDYVCSYGTVDGVTLIFNDNQTFEIDNVPVDFTATLIADGITISGEIPITFTLNGKDAGNSYIYDNEATFSADKKYGGKYILGGYINGASDLDIRTATLIYSLPGLLADVWVSKKGDDANGDGSRGNPYATIEKALTMVYDEGSTIHMLNGTYQFENRITISPAVTIIGEEEGVIFDGSSSQLFYIEDSADLTIKNITFANAKSLQMIYNSGSLTIDNCIFENNTGTSANTLLIFSYEGDLNLYNSIFRNNTVASSGSSLGVLIYQLGETKIANTSFYSNNVNSQSSLIYVLNQEIWDMTTWRSHWTNYGASIENCKFENNSGLIISCESIDLPISDSVFSNNTGKYVLGLLNGYSRASHVLNVSNSNFTDNNVSEGIVEIQKDILAIQNNIFANNTGCVVFSSGYNSHEIIVSDNTVSNNSKNDYGNYMYISSNAKITGSTLQLIFSNNGSHVVEGFEMPLNATLVDEDGNQINGIYVSFYLNDKYDSQVQIIQGVAQYSKSVSQSGNYTLSGTPQMANSNAVEILTAEFEVRIADSKVIYVDVFGDDEDGDGSEYNPYASLSRAFEDINAVNTTIYIMPGVYSGELNYDKEIDIPSGAYVEIIGLSEFGDDVIFKDLSNRFLGFTNKAGGFSYDARFAVKNIIFRNSTFENGFITAESVSVLLDNISFINATPRRLAVGGDMGFELTVSNVDIDFNNATFTDSAPFISTVPPQSNSGSVKLINTSFKNGNFENVQYFIYSGGSSDIINSTFTGLSASMGGMSYLIYSWGSLNINNSVFINNSANSMIDKFNRDGSISNSVFDSNMVTGGFFISNNGELTISNCAIVNITSYDGNAYLFGKGSSAAIFIYENWFGNNNLTLNPGVKFNMVVPNWVIANVDVADIIVGEDVDFDVYFTSADGSALEGVIPSRFVEFILEDEVASFELSNNRLNVTCTFEIDGVLTVKVDGETFTFDIEKGTLVVLAEEEIYYDSAIDYEVTLASGERLANNVTFTVTIGDVEFANVTTDENGTVILDLSGFKAGEYEVTYDIPETSIFNAASGNYTLTINKAAPEIVVNPTATDGVIEISVPDDITENLTALIDDEEYEVLVNGTTATVNVSDLKPGKYTAFISYPGDNNYEPVTVVETIVIPKEEVTPEITFEDGTITVELPEDATGYVLVDVNGTTFWAPVEDGIAEVELTGLEAGNYTADVIYTGDETYDEAYATTDVEIPEYVPLDPELNVTVEDTIIKVTINENATGIVVISVGEFAFVYEAEEGEFIVDASVLAPDTYDVIVTYTGDDIFAADNATDKVTVPEYVPLDPELNVTVEDTTVIISLNENATGGVLVSGIEDNVIYYEFDGEDIEIDLFFPGNYTIDVYYEGDDIFASDNKTVKVEIPEYVPLDPELNLTIVNTTITVTIDEDATGLLIVTIGDISYVRDATDAPIVLNVVDMDPATYDVLVEYYGDEIFAAANATGKVTVPSDKNDTPIDPKADIKISEDGVNVVLPSDATGYVLVDVDDDIYYVPVQKGKASFEMPELAPGNYTVDVYYSGDDKYAPANATGKIEIPEYVPVDPELEVKVVNTTLIVTINENATGIVKVRVGDFAFVYDAEDAPITIDVSYYAPGTYDVVAEYLGDDVFANATATANVTVPEYVPLDPELEIKVVNTTIFVTLNENATGIVKVRVGDVVFIYDVEEGPIVVDVSDFAPGTYDVVAKYLGDDVFANATVNSTVTVPEIVPEDPELKITVENTTIFVTLNENATGIVKVRVGDVVFIYDVEDEPIIIDVSDFAAGTYEVVAKYLGDDVFANATVNSTVTVPEIVPEDPELKITVVNTTVIVTIDEDATGVILVRVGDFAFVYDAEDAPIVIDVSDYAPGTYDVVAKYLGDDIFANATVNSTVTVPEIEPEDANLTATAQNTTITVTVNENATGFVLVDVDGTGYYAPIEDGQATVNVIGLDEGEYAASVTYTGDDTFAPANTTVAITVPSSGKNDTPVDPKADINISENGIEVTLPEDATGYVLADVDGETSWAPVENGKASIELPELAPGNHTVSVTYTGDKKYDSANATATITVEAPEETIFSEDLVKVEKAPDRFEANFTDAEGKPLANASVTFELNGNVYTRTTDANGKAGMNINLEAGNYTIVITNPVTGEVKNNTITVLSRFVDANDLVKYFRNESQYVITVLGDDGKIAANGTVVTFNINGVFYNRTVNESGQVKLSINLNPGDYIITAEYKGCRVSNNIKVLPVLTGNDLTKKYGVPGAYEATLVDGQGKPYADQEIEFNINGVFYKRTTDSNGVAKLNINLMPGKYIITGTYGAAAISNNVTVTE